MEIFSESAGLVLAASSAFFCQNAFAESTGSLENLSKVSGLSAFISTVIEDHPAIRAKFEILQERNKGIDTANKQFWPAPSVAVDGGPRNIEGSNKVLLFRLSTPIYTGGFLDADLEIAELNQAGALLDLTSARKDFARQVAEAYCRWWLSSARHSVLEESRQQMADIYEMVTHRVGSGVSSVADALQARMQLSRLHRDFLLSAQQVQQSRDLLSSMAANPTALPSFLPLDIDGMLTDSAIAFLQARSINQHPQLQQAELSVALAQAEARKAAASLRPKVTARLEKQYGAYLGSLNADTRFYINSEFQLGAGFSSVSAAEQAQMKIASAESSLQGSRLQLEQQIAQATYDVLQSQVQLASLIEQIQTQSKLLKSGMRLLESGRRTWIDLLNMQREWNQLRIQRAEVEATVLINTLRLQILADQLPGVTLSLG